MLVAVAYDVVDDTRRTRLHERLKDSGTPVQNSVFECLLEEGDLVRVEKAIAALICCTSSKMRTDVRSARIGLAAKKVGDPRKSRKRPCE